MSVVTHSPEAPRSAKNNGRVALMLGGLAAGMVGLAFASVPLYQLFCQMTGYGGTTQAADANPKGVIAREMKVRFDVNIESSLPWTVKAAAPITDRIGKNTGDDFRERKLTLPVIKAVALADADERAFWQRTIERGDQRDGDLDQALAILGRHGAIQAARADAVARAARARAALAALPPHPVRDLLAEMADFVVARVA